MQCRDVEIYLTNFSELIDKYRAGGSKGRTSQNAVTFVFMTGYARGLDGDTPEPPYIKSPYQNHKRIVDFCKTNGYFCLDYWSQDTYNYGDDSYKPTEDGNINAQHLAWVNDPNNELGTDWFLVLLPFVAERKYHASGACQSALERQSPRIRCLVDFCQTGRMGWHTGITAFLEWGSATLF